MLFTRQAIIAAAVLGCFSGLSAAQSSLTFFGFVNSAYVKKIGEDIQRLDEGAQSRWGVRGKEDLGGGMNAFFALESRFKSDSGEQNGIRVFQGQSILGMEGPWGKVSLGRDYVAGYIEAQLLADPFIHTGVASMVAIGTGGIGTVRSDGTITYMYKGEGWNISAQRANAVNPGTNTVNFAIPNHPVSVGASYRSGRYYAAFSYDNPGGLNDSWQFATLHAPLGPATLTAGYGSGQAEDKSKRRSYMVGAFLPVGPGVFKISYGDLSNTSSHLSMVRKYAVGYNHSLSKRTFLFLNVARDERVLKNNAGYDMGIQHNF